VSRTVAGSGVTTVLRSTTRVVRTLEGMPQLPHRNDMRRRSFEPTRLVEVLHEAEPRHDVPADRPERGPYSVEADGPMLNADGSHHASQTGRLRWHGVDVDDLVRRAGMPEAFRPFLIGPDELSDWREP